MKKILLSLVAMMIATVSFAQNTLVATLTHGDDIKMFYGAFALRDAHNAAANGDIINLSGGVFQSVNITKALVIRGTGIDVAAPTYINGNFDVNIPGDVTERLSFEGCRISNTITVKGTLKNPYFMKSAISRMNIDYYASMGNCTFVNSQLYNMDLNGKSTVQFLNSRVDGFINNAETSATASFINCVIVPRNGYEAYYIKSSILVNSILYWTHNSSNSLPSTTNAINCVAVGNGSGSAFRDLAAKQNCSYAGLDIFKDSNIWADLTDEAKERYIGNDGTPVGMYGGVLPYNTTPSYPHITKMNVANKTTADGKLSVEIEVSAAQ